MLADQRLGRRRPGVLVGRGEREAREGDAVDPHLQRTHCRKHRISVRLRAERLHGLGEDLRREERVVRRLLVGELEDERHVRRRAFRERLGQRPQRDVHVLAERDVVAPGKAAAGVDQNGVARIDPRDGLRDVRLRIGSRADDDDVKPVRSQPAP